MRTGVIFACTIIDHNRAFVLHKFLQTFKDYFSDCDLYIGINPVSIQETESIIEKYNLNSTMGRVEDSLYSESDASAYQLGLRLLKQSQQTYDNYWFIHTKSGVNSHSDYLREWYLDEFLKQRNSIEKFLALNPNIGSYGKLAIEFRDVDNTDVEIPLYENSKTVDLPNTHAPFYYLHSIYVLSCKPIEKFLSLITDKWFTTKLDRYYFEGVFYFIVSRAGYFPYVSNRYSCNGKDLKPLMDKWIVENTLEHYNDYLDKYETNYTFNQLTPPYASSNS